MEKKRSEVKLIVLLKYYALFIVPVLISFLISWKISSYLGPILQVSNNVAIQIQMVIFTFFIFSFLVPYIRRQENITGVRYALVGFFLFGIFMTVPSLIKGYSGMILTQFLYLANYILLTFIYAPEVMGINISLKVWFSKSRQLLVIFVYLSIVLFYAMGFGWLFYEMAVDPVYPNAFRMDPGESLDYGTFLYFSVTTFTTIGYGDITPLSVGARLLVGLEAILGMIINVVFIAILFMYISNIQAFIREEEEHIESMEAKLEKEGKKLEKEEQLLKEELGIHRKEEHTEETKNPPPLNIEEKIP